MKYKIFYQENNKIKIKTINNTNTKQFPSNIIKIEEVKNLKDYTNITFSSYKDVIDIFKELTIILDTNLSLSQGIDILLKGNQNNKIHQVLLTIHNALQNAQPIYLALKKHQNYIGDLPILFFQLGEQNADMKGTISALSKILIENQNSRKQFFDALSYPIFLTITLFLSVVIIFNFVIPQLLSSFRNIPRHQ